MRKGTCPAAKYSGMMPCVFRLTVPHDSSPGGDCVQPSCAATAAALGRACEGDHRAFPLHLVL